jgi:calcineurin-like phosphoesterase family protein
MANRWFISDHHLHHGKIIKYQNRPFKDIWEMGAVLLENHNKVVKPEDHVSFLGDITIRRGGRIDKEWFCTEMKKYNGHKRLYLGNHDHFPIQTYLDAGFEKIYATWRDESGLLYSHFPIHPDNLGSARANIHGHIHSNPSPKPMIGVSKEGKVYIKPYINVSVEALDYKPISHEQLMAIVEKVRNDDTNCT